MPSPEQIQKDIQAFPEEAQLLLVDFLEILKKRYPTGNRTEAKEDSSYQKFKANGFIGCVSIEENLSTTYKQVLSEKWNEKYDRR